MSCNYIIVYLQLSFNTIRVSMLLAQSLCEVFNSKIVEVRDKPILPMYEIIKRDLIASIVKNMDWMSAFHESSSLHSSPFV